MRAASAMATPRQRHSVLVEPGNGPHAFGLIVLPFEQLRLHGHAMTRSHLSEALYGIPSSAVRTAAAITDA